MKFLRLLLLSLFCLGALGSPLLAASSTRIPVILDTDLGTDIDDTWALAQLLRSPELDLKLVVSDSGDTHYRAALIAKLLETAGRTDVAVGIGLPQGPMDEAMKNQAPWLRDYDLKRYPGKTYTDGIDGLIEVIMSSPQPVTLIGTGPVPNLAEALRREPRIAGKCRFIGMHGSFRVGYGGSTQIVAESNVKEDPAAFRAVLAAPWLDCLLTPLDTCGTVGLAGEDYRAIWSATPDPLLRAVIENYCIFAPRVNWVKCDFFATRSTTLFDCVAVYLAYSEDLVTVETLTFDVTDEGYTRLSPTGGLKARAATAWKDRAAFEHQLAQRLLRGAPVATLSP